MDDLRRSPFKVAKIENDPTAFGRRVEDVLACATALFNRRHVLISGPRGIGKSSLGSQLQTAYEGNHILLERCLVESKLPRYLCSFYACDSTTTLSELCLEILYSLERRYLMLKSAKFEKVKITVELDLKLVKAKIESDVVTRRPATLATELVLGLSEVLRSARLLGLQGINVMIDELDLLSRDINFGHFVKIVHETLGRESIDDVTFIFAGQRGIYSRLLQEDNSVERHIRHVPISVLEPEEARYVLDFASNNAIPPFEISRRASEMILSIAAGYPYDIHLIGDAAFAAMQKPNEMQPSDVLRGLNDILRSDKREKYLEKLRALNDNERLIIVSLARYSDKHIPMRIPLSWLEENLVGPLPDDVPLEEILGSLGRSGYITINEKDGVCQFREELLRIFTSLLLLDDREIEARRLELEKSRPYSADKIPVLPVEVERQFLRDLISGTIDDNRINMAIRMLDSTEFDAYWEREDDSGLTRFRR